MVRIAMIIIVNDPGGIPGAGRKIRLRGCRNRSLGSPSQGMKTTGPTGLPGTNSIFRV